MFLTGNRTRALPLASGATPSQAAQCRNAAMRCDAMRCDAMRWYDVASHRIASHRIASHRIASCQALPQPVPLATYCLLLTTYYLPQPVPLAIGKLIGLPLVNVVDRRLGDRPRVVVLHLGYSILYIYYIKHIQS